MFTAYIDILPTVLIAVSTWVAFEAIRRLLLRPLAQIPDPRLAALNYWYEAHYDVVKPGQYAFKLKELDWLNSRLGAQRIIISTKSDVKL